MFSFLFCSLPLFFFQLARLHAHLSSLQSFLTLQLPETHIAEFANSVDLDEVAHNEPPYLDLHCLPSSL